MLPRELKTEQFAGYPPEARKLVVDYLSTVQHSPLSFVPSLLRELIDFDFKFPAERNAREKELANLRALSACSAERMVSRVFGNSAFTAARSVRLGKVRPPSSSNSCLPISGARINSMRFARPRTSMRIVCGRRCQPEPPASSTTRNHGHRPGSGFV